MRTRFTFDSPPRPALDPDIEVRQVGPDHWAAVRSVRLAALQESPDWFWSTYEEEVDHDEAWWRDRISMGGWFLAYIEDQARGIAAGIRSPYVAPNERELISMWVEPGARGRGVGHRLVTTVVEWAKGDAADAVQLMVTSANFTAARLYERCGFEYTGLSQPLPRKPELVEREMRLRFSPKT